MEEVMNNMEQTGAESTLLMIGMSRKSDDLKTAFTLEEYKSLDLSDYDLDGIIIRNEEEDIDILFSAKESEATFGEGPEDIPETDKRRKNAPKNPTFNELDGYMRTQWQLDNHQDTHEEGCAICEAVKFGWLPSNGEMTLAINSIEKFNELAEECGADKLEAEGYWCSTQYSPDYMWCYDMTEKAFIFWKSKATTMAVRPVKSSSEYQVLNND